MKLFGDLKSHSAESVLYWLKWIKKLRTSKETKLGSLGQYYLVKAMVPFMRKSFATQPKYKSGIDYTAILSMVPGSKIPWTLEFKYPLKVKELVYFVPGAGRNALGVSTITHGDFLQAGILCDTSYFQRSTEHKEFIDCFEQNLN